MDDPLYQSGGVIMTSTIEVTTKSERILLKKKKKKPSKQLSS